MKPEEMMPPAEKLPTIGSVKEARKLLAQDKALALKTLDEVSEERLNTEISKAPWDNSNMVLGRRLLQMVAHLWQHMVTDDLGIKVRVLETLRSKERQV